MRKIVLITILGFLLINISALLIIVANLNIVERHFREVLIINESLNERLALYERSFRLIEAKDIEMPEQKKIVVNNIKESLSSCYRCHDLPSPVGKKIEEIEKGLNVYLDKALESASLINNIINFSSMAFDKAKLSFMYKAGKFRTSLKMVNVSLLLTAFIGAGFILLLSLYSLKKVSSLEEDIKSKEKIITDWALEWQETFDSVKDMIIIFDKSGRPKAYNTSAAEFFKDGLLREEFCKYFFNLRCPCQPVSDRIVIKDRIFDMAVYEMKDDTRRCIMVLRDITEKKEMEEKLRRAERLSSLGLMAGGISHEINNPLTAVVGFSELLLFQEEDEKKKGYLEQILGSAKRIQRIVNDLLVLGRKGEIRSEEVMIEDFIDEVLKNFNNIKDIKLIKRFSGIGSLRIDRGLFELVFLNLINNAIQAIRDSGSGDTVELRTSKVNGAVRIEVSDNGPGIPENNISRIFDPFFTTKEVGKGSGLGLAIAHNIIAAHGGDISVRSKVGEGTTFIITIPY